MILDSGRQTFCYLDSFPLIVHLSCAKMHFLSVWLYFPHGDSRNESIGWSKEKVLKAKFHWGLFLQICVDYWDRLDRRVLIWFIYHALFYLLAAVLLLCCQNNNKIMSTADIYFLLIIFCLRCSWRKGVPGYTSPCVPTRAHVINIHFHFTKSVYATVNSLMGAGCGRKV